MNRKMDNGLTRKMDKRFAREWIQKQTKTLDKNRCIKRGKERQKNVHDLLLQKQMKSLSIELMQKETKLGHKDDGT